MLTLSRQVLRKKNRFFKNLTLKRYVFRHFIFWSPVLKKSLHMTGQRDMTSIYGTNLVNKQIRTYLSLLHLSPKTIITVQISYFTIQIQRGSKYQTSKIWTSNWMHSNSGLVMNLLGIMVVTLLYSISGPVQRQLGFFLLSISHGWYSNGLKLKYSLKKHLNTSSIQIPTVHWTPDVG
jgi:hypothetical protein